MSHRDRPSRVDFIKFLGFFAAIFALLYVAFLVLYVTVGPLIAGPR